MSRYFSATSKAVLRFVRGSSYREKERLIRTETRTLGTPPLGRQSKQGTEVTACQPLSGGSSGCRRLFSLAGELEGSFPLLRLR